MYISVNEKYKRKEPMLWKWVEREREQNGVREKKAEKVTCNDKRGITLAAFFIALERERVKEKLKKTATFARVNEQ